ncbi:MAG: hypothetical protein ABH840_02985 [Nanoarchaeota archaeon]
MVWPFRKRGDVIDLTYLAKRGLINVPEQEEYKDLTPVTSEATSSDSDFSFLGAMASSAEPASTAESTAKRPTPGISSNKIEDIEFKLDTITKRVNTMLDRLDLVEKKLSRDLRQSS